MAYGLRFGFRGLEASKGGMKVGGMFPNKGPYIRDP